MTKKNRQRIGVFIIAVVMLVGTIGSFMIMILADHNASQDQQQIAKLEADYQKEMEAYQAKLSEQADELSDKYFDQFSRHQDEVSKFDAKSVKELKTRDLALGSGERVDEDTEYSAYYIGWTPDGKVFEQSIDNGRLRAPIQSGSLIEGWTKGVIGMKLGGVRELTIPADMAYGESGTDTIEPNTPLKFIVMVIERPDEIEQPGMPEELLKYYQQQSY